MKILVVGGGSGGHITPAVAVVREILSRKPRTKVEFWTDRRYYKNVVRVTTELEGVSWGEKDASSGPKVQYIRVRKVAAGKFRRYNWSFKEYFTNFGITFRELFLGNIVGFCGFVAGIFQSFFRLIRPSRRPDVIFLKGGFVGLPVGIVARIFRIPYVVHESDSVPGLANRLLMRHANTIAYGFGETNASVAPSGHAPGRSSPLRGSHVPRGEGQVLMSPEVERSRPKSVVVGIPVAPEFKKVSKTKQEELKRALGFDPERPLVIVTGGSQGAMHINLVMREILPEMLKFASVGLIAGRKHYEDMVDLKKYEEWDKARLKSNFRMWNFSPVMDELMGAADVVVSRAGATTIAELAALQKAVVLVPFEKLPGGHQLKNAERLEKDGAVMLVRDDKMVKKPELLLEATRKLVRSPKVRADMAAALHEKVKPDAAASLAEMLLEIGRG